MHNYDWLIGRLDAFIRKYYANLLIRGSLVFFSCLLFFYLTASLGEYFFYLPSWARVTILGFFVVAGCSSLIAWVIIPLFKMWRLGKVISHEAAAQIIGAHFPEVADKLLNILQLKRHPDNNASRALAEASIEQKISTIAVVPISAAIDLGSNRRLLPYLLPTLLAIVTILIAAPRIFSESSKRLLQPTKTFEKPAPFEFIIRNTNLNAIRNNDFVLEAEVRGARLPAELSVDINGETLPMQPIEGHAFRYSFRNVTNSISFRLSGAGFRSEEKTIRVVDKPTLKSFRVQLSYPAYTRKKAESLSSLGDLTIPAGTVVSWAMLTEYTDVATIRLGGGVASDLVKNATIFGSQYRFLNDTDYTINLYNKSFATSDSFHYHVQVVPDQYPVVQVQQFKDSVSGKQILLTGTAGDDYGISKVTFNYSVTEKNREVAHKSVSLPVASGVLATFQYYFNIETLDLQQGQKLSYYIEAWDNDGVHGPKSAKSELMSYQMYEGQQLDSAINENAQQINSGISNSAQKNQQMESDNREMQTKMLESDNLDWNQQQSMQEMLKKQTDLKTQVEQIKQRFDDQMKETEKKDYSDNIRDKQKDLEKQLDNMLNQELKDALKKLQEMMQKLIKDQALEAMKQVAQENKLFKMDMERMQALMNKLELQMKMEDMASKLDELAQKQNDLKEKTEQQTGDKNEKREGDSKTGKDNKTGKDETAAKKDESEKNGENSGDKKDDKQLAKEQQELKDKLDKLMKEDMKDMDKLAKETKEEKQLDRPKEEGKEAQEDMKESADAMAQKQKSKSAKSQSKASQKMKDMASSLRKKSAEMDADELDLDIKATRQVLSNLIRLSFDQEDLMASVRKTATSSHIYVENQEEQNRLHRNSMMIRDSLFSLGKRVSKLSATINKETTDIEHNMQLTVNELEDRNTPAAISHQQYVMTHVNNLALNLNELLANLMQMQMPPQNGGGGGSCKKPGGQMPKPGEGSQLSDIITEQQQLGDAMQQMQAKQGKKPGGKDGDKQGGDWKKPGGSKGNKPGSGAGGGSGNGGSGNGDQESENGDAEQLARLADQQAALRHKIQELSSLLNSKGMGGSAKQLQEAEQKMDKNETDLVNRKLTSELMLRQRDILTRLLETDKAVRQQEQDDKRSSKSADQISGPIPPQLQKYITERKQLLELYHTVPPQLRPYYRDMVNNYFQIIGNTK